MNQISNPSNWDLTQPYSLSPVAADGICGIGISPLRLVGSPAIKLGIEGGPSAAVAADFDPKRERGNMALQCFPLSSPQMKGPYYYLHQRVHGPKLLGRGGR